MVRISATAPPCSLRNPEAVIIGFTDITRRHTSRSCMSAGELTQKFQVTRPGSTVPTVTKAVDGLGYGRPSSGAACVMAYLSISKKYSRPISLCMRRGGQRFGSRLLFEGKGHLFFSVGVKALIELHAGVAIDTSIQCQLDRSQQT
jgi:hypothetical protein